MQELYFFILYFLVYSFFGWCTEVAFAAWKEHRFINRGFLNGPYCPIYGFGVGIVIQFLTPYKSNLILLYAASVVLVTILEWLTGFILEKLFHNKWWDYSDLPFNLNGYVCLLFSMLWGTACVLIVDFIHPVIHRLLARLPRPVGIFLIVVLLLLLLIDLYVTASGILKMNRHLARMQEIADELHQISEHLGEHIYERTLSVIDAQEDLKDILAEKQENLKDILAEKQEDLKNAIADKQEDLKDVSDDMKDRITDLLRRYQETGRSASRIQKRLMKAFPKMESRNYKETLEDLRKKLKEWDEKHHW